MKAKASLLIVEDNAELRQTIGRMFEKSDEIEVCGYAGNGIQALEQCERLNPDIMSLDLIMPQLDGMAVLERISEMDKPPMVMILSALAHEMFITRAIERGADYYMAKPFEQEAYMNRILDMAGIITGSSSVQKPIKAKTYQKEEKERPKSIDEKVSGVFITIGIPAHIKGYQYLREAIKLVIENPDIINRITKELYPTIGEKFSTSASKVERAIRHAIDVAWNRGRIENVNQFIGYNVYSRYEKPTNGEFIALIADKLVLEKTA